MLLCIPKILKNESNSQPKVWEDFKKVCCCVSQRYWKMKAIHNSLLTLLFPNPVVVYPKDTEKWKQFTTVSYNGYSIASLLCIPKILKNESNSQRYLLTLANSLRCCVSQRYWKMKAIHNALRCWLYHYNVVVYPKDTEKWKQFTTSNYKGY